MTWLRILDSVIRHNGFRSHFQIPGDASNIIGIKEESMSQLSMHNENEPFNELEFEAEPILDTMQEMESQVEPQGGSQVASQYESQYDSQYESQVDSQVESQNRRGKHSIPRMYGVYLLKSQPKKSCFYVGSTPDPIRRLRQHNGELARGGAYRTKKKGYRPWKLVFYVFGFPNKISALQFEHAWQHAYQTRHIPFEKRLNPGKRHTGSGTSLHGKIANCRLLLNSNGFARLGLKVVIFDSSVYDVWLKNKFCIPVPSELQIDVRIRAEETSEVASGSGNYTQLKEFMDSNSLFQDNYFRKCTELYSKRDELKVCKLCDKEVRVEEGLHTMCVCVHSECECIYHLFCLSEKFLEGEKEDSGEPGENVFHVLPKKGKCVGCNKINFWNLIIRGAMNLQQDI